MAEISHKPFDREEKHSVLLLGRMLYSEFPEDKDYIDFLLSSRGSRGLISFLDDVLIGGCLGNFQDCNARLNFLVVNPKFRGRGFGTSVLREFELMGRNNGCVKIDLYADENSRDWFKKQGYYLGNSSYGIFYLSKKL